MTTFRSRSLMVAFGVLALGTSLPKAEAGIVLYQDLPTLASNLQSFHNTTGPILADDFASAVGTGGSVTQVTWWGSAAASTSWEVTFHPNDPILGQPAIVPNGHGGLSEILTAIVTPTLLPGIFRYDAAWDRSQYNIHVLGGTEMWFSVANTSPNWTWALALNGPTIGTELFNAHQSTGGLAPDGGPHAGPWTDVHTDLAFQIATVPEPSTIVAAGFAGVMGVFYAVRRRKRASA